MKGKIPDEVRLRHILDAIAFIEKFSTGKSKEDFYTDFMYRFSVERQLEIIGEAASKLSRSFIAKHTYVPWREIISFRNFLAHEYFGLDIELVWGIVVNHIPTLKINTEKILKEISG